MFPYCCGNVTGVDFESNKASAREGFLDSVLRIDHFLGALYYVRSCEWEESLLQLVLHHSQKLEVLEGCSSFKHSSCREDVVLAGGSC